MLVLAIGNLGFAIVMGGYARSGADNAALRLWRLAKLVQGAAHFLAWTQPAGAVAWPAAIATAVLVLGVMTEVSAYISFFGCRRWRRLLYPACTLALLAYFGACLYGVEARIVNAMISVLFALLTASRASLLLRTPGASVLQRIVGANDLVFFGAMSLHAWVGMAGDTAWLPAQAVLSLTYFTAYLLMIVNSFGFLLLCKEKDDAKLAQLATIDSLTGLVNRRAFFEQTERARLVALRQRQTVAMLMLDIDYFKRLNDRYGHAAGDEALRAFARVAQATLREQDILGRLGGEEFALVLPATDLVGAMQAAERLRAAVETAPLAIEGQTVVLTVSIGVVMVDAAEHINTALARADHALYTAKSAGRNRVEVGLVKRRAAQGG